MTPESASLFIHLGTFVVGWVVFKVLEARR